MTQNFVQHLFIAFAKITNKITIFSDRISVVVFFIEIFNFIGYANNKTCDITLHYNF